MDSSEKSEMEPSKIGQNDAPVEKKNMEPSVPETSQVDEPSKKEKKPSMRSGKSKKSIWIAAISIAIVIMLVSGIFGVQIYAQSALEKTEIDVLGLSVVSSTADTLNLEMDIAITEPTGKDVYYDSLDLDIYSDDILMGRAAVPSSKLQAGTSTVLVTFTVEDSDSFDNFLNDFFGKASVPINLKGQISVRSGGFLGAYTFSLDMDKNIDIPGFTGLDIAIPKLELSSTGNGRCLLNATVSVTNPSKLSIELGSAAFNLTTVFGYLGNGIGQGITLSPGTTNFTMYLDTKDADPSVLGGVIYNFLSGKETLVNITGSWETAMPGLLGGVFTNFRASTVISQTSSSLTFTSLKGMVDLNVNSIDIVNTTDTSILVRTSLDINNDLGMRADIPGFDVDLVTSAGPLGTVSIGNLTLVPGNNAATIETWLTPDAKALGFVVLNYLEGVNTTVFIQGGNNRGGALLGDILTELNLTVELTTDGKIRTADFGFELVSLDLTNQTMGVDISLNITNPGSFSAELDSLTADLYYNDTIFATAIIGNVKILTGLNTVTRQVDVAVQDMATAMLVAGRYLAGIDTGIIASLESSVGASCITDTITANFMVNLTLAGLSSGIGLDITYVVLAGTTQNGFIFDADVRFTNPTAIEGPMSPIEFDILDSGSNNIGNLTVPQITILSGTRTYHVAGILTYIPDAADIDAVVQELFSGNDVTLTLAASTANGDMMSYLLDGFTVPVTLTATGSLGVDLLDIRLVSADEANATFTMALSVGISNPTTFSAMLVNGTVDIGYNTPSSRESLGVAYVNDLFVPVGYSVIEITGTLSPVNLTLTRNIIRDYLSGDNVTLDLETSMGFKGNGSASLFYINASSDMPLPACRALELIVDDVKLLDTTDATLILGVDLRVYNPTIVQGSIPAIPFDLIYNGSAIGSFETGLWYLIHGWNAYNVTVNITTLDQAEMNDFVTAFLNGDIIHITVRANSSTTLGYLLSGLEFDITLGTGVSIEFNIYDPVLVNTTADSLLFDVSVGVYNPSTLSVSLNDTVLDVFYRGQDIGDLTIDNQTIAPGDNIISTQMNLTSANITALEEILHEYITGNDTSFLVTGIYRVCAPGADQPVNLSLSIAVIFPGIDEPVIGGVTVKDINVVIGVAYSGFPPVPTITVTYYVNITAHLNNPTTVEFNVTHLKYDVYFDDSDGATYLILGYGAKNNIYVTTVNENIAPAMHFNASESRDRTTMFVGSNLETGIRLNDEYIKDKLYLDLLNGVMSLDIGNFSIDVPFQFLNVHVVNGG